MHQQSSGRPDLCPDPGGYRLRARPGGHARQGRDLGPGRACGGPVMVNAFLLSAPLLGRRGLYTSTATGQAHPWAQGRCIRPPGLARVAYTPRLGPGMGLASGSGSDQPFLGELWSLPPWGNPSYRRSLERGAEVDGSPRGVRTTAPPEVAGLLRPAEGGWRAPHGAASPLGARREELEATAGGVASVGPARRGSPLWAAAARRRRPLDHLRRPAHWACALVAIQDAVRRASASSP